MTMRQADAFVAAARALLGVPFRHQGRDPVHGVDCIGLAVLAARAIGLNPPDRTDYPRQPTGQLAPALAGYLQPIDLADVKPGDLYLLAFAHEPMHLGIATDIGLLHTFSQVGRVVEHGLDAKWRRRIVAAYRLPVIPAQAGIQES